MDQIDSFNEKKLRKILERAMNIALKYDNEFCSFDHMILSALELISNDENYSTFIKKFNIAEIIKSIEKLLSNDYRRKYYSLYPKFTKYSIDILSEKISKLESQNKKYFDYYDLFHLILVEDETNSAMSKHIIFSKISEDDFFEELNKIKEKSLIDGEEVDIKELENIIEQHCINLNKLAIQDKIDPLIGRSKEIYSIAKVLCRRIKNNVILVGDPGVGKTAIVEGLAKKIVEKDIFLPLMNSVIYSLPVSNLMAGTKYRGDLEERIKTILELITKISKLKNIMPIIFIDEIHMIIGAGTTTENKIDIANILKPLLQKGEIKVIGSTTFDEYSKFIEKDKALERRFQKVIVEEPSEKETIDIIMGLRKYYEDFHNVEYSDKAIELAVKLSKKFIHKSFLPDKAIDIIDNVAAKLKLHRDNEDNVIKIGEEHIIDEISEIAKVPKEKMFVEKNSENNLMNMASKLKEIIYGQDESIDDIVSTILVARSGLRDPEKPEAAFLINGPTGTGKTELCKQIAKILNMNFARLDMSEFMEKHSVSKLIGAPPGYVGYDDNGGKLINIVDKNPNSVILFDEIEKAHPDIINILLQVLDYGKLTNTHNKVAKFNNCIIFMTSNLGSANVDKKSMGFVDNINENPQNEEIKKFFTPEFRNRLDGIIIFNKLSREVSVKIINKFISDLRDNYLKEKNIDIEIDDKAIEFLLEKGFDEKMGARPLARIIDKKIKHKIASEILFGKLKKGGLISATSDGKELYLDIKGNNHEE